MTYFYPQSEHDRQVAALTRRLVLLRKAVQKNAGHYTHVSFQAFLSLVKEKVQLENSRPQAV
jgi:hypothetical protein